MRKLPPLLFASIYCIFPILLFAATDTTVVDFRVTYREYVSLIGSAVGITKYFTVDEIKPAGRRGPGPTVTIGQLGLESNVSGTCTLDFSTTNRFTLRHIDNNRRLTRYQLDYKGFTIDRNNTTMVLPSCNEVTSSIDFTAVGRFRRRVRAGIYQDIVTITVTTQ